MLPGSRMNFTSFSGLARGAAALSLLAIGCGDAVSTGLGGGRTDASATDVPAADVSTSRDAPTAMDVVAPVDAGPPQVDSGCPAPPRITIDNVPSDYLPPQRVTYIRGVDGDTAHFAFPVVGETTVRFLWVNTEESHGADTTAFGVRTAAEVARIMETGTVFHVAPHRRTAGSNLPQLDPYMRTLALVFMDGELLQTRLVREGWSAYYTDFGCPVPPIHQSLLYAEAEARANQRGIWAPGHPTNYREVFSRWIPTRNPCRPNPFLGQRYCN